MNIREKLLEALQNSKLSANEIARQTGIPQPTISRFIQGETDMRISAADKLATYFGLEIGPAKPTKPAKKSPKK